MENIRWWLFVGASIFALTGVYILWGPSQRPKKRRKDAVPGLQNLGNSCFLNAVLQALASCPLVIRWLRTATSTTSENENANSSNLATSLLSILTALNSQTETYKNMELCDPSPVIEALRARRWVISNEEQDAHELFHVLTTTLEEEFAATPPVLSLLEVGKLEESSKALLGGSQKAFITSSINSAVKYTSPTRGLLASQLKCKRCDFRHPVRYDTFDSISLAIPTPHWGQLQLQDCLQKFITCELVDDVTCDNCTKQLQMPDDTKMHEAKTTFIKQLVFGKLPECLCIHIQRTVWLNNGMPMKCFDHIAFPEFLAMDDYVYSSKKKNKNDGMAYPWARLIGGGCLKDEGHQILLPCPTLSPSKAAISQPAILNTLQNQSQYTRNTISCMLPIDKSFSSQTSEHVYMLKAVIVHLGDMFSGHFITYRRGPVDTHARHKWFCTSDSTVKEVSLSKVLQDCAYMLFYEKITLNK